MEKDLTILLVEDNPGDVLIMEEFLEEEELDFRIEIAETLEQGLKAVKTRKFNIILLDLGLPDAVGMQALVEMTKVATTTPIIVITGLNDEKIGRKAVTLGAQNYLVKGKMNSQLITESIWYSIERNEHLKKIRKSEQELAEKNKQLDELNQSKDRLISILSHDLRGPMQSANSLLELLVNNYDDFDNQEIRDMVTASFKSIYSTSELLETILVWARSQSKKFHTKPEELNLWQLADDATDALKTAAINKQIKLKNNIKKETTLFADRQMILTVIRNLVSNAIKFTKANGRITLGVKSTSKEKIHFYVEDNGVGIEKTNLENIFNEGNEFSTTGTQNEKGTGFGLNICKDFVGKNNGRIWVESEPGKGTTVHVELPVNASSGKP